MRVQALSLRCDFITRETAFGSCLVVCAPAFAIVRSRVRFPPGPRQLRLKQRSRSMWSVLLAAPTEAQTYSARSTSTAQLRLSILRASCPLQAAARKWLDTCLQAVLRTLCKFLFARRSALVCSLEQFSLRRRCHVSSCRTMRRSSHVTIHIEHRRAQTRIDVKGVSAAGRALGENAFGPIALFERRPQLVNLGIRQEDCVG